MNRRELLKQSAAFGLTAGVSLAMRETLLAQNKFPQTKGPHPSQSVDRPLPLSPPATGPVPVAFVISEGAVVIDFCGPWEVFQDVHTADGTEFFDLYTVAETKEPIRASGGLKIVPDYTFQTAPSPKVVVIPAQNGESAAIMEWIRASSKSADVTMSVCTGAFTLAKTGLLSGKAATTHHSAYSEFAMQYPDVHLKRGARFVEDGNLASAGGLSSGIDLALRVVQRYYGRKRAEQTADMMEYQGKGWLDPNSNQAYAKPPVSTEKHPVCPVCLMDGDHSQKSVYKGKAYYFCSEDHKQLFDKDPDKFLKANQGH